MLNELFGLEGETAVVTGAGRGIGEGIAKVLAAAGANVVCAARRTDEIDRVAKEINDSGGKAIACTTDVTDDDAVRSLAQTAIDKFGGLHMWVNNAGGSPIQSPLIKLGREEWDNTMALNLTAIWVCTRVAAEMMEKGRILNISSLAAEDVIPGSGHYSAAKAGVNMLTKTFAKELGPRIRVNCIMPGAVPTEIMMQALKLTDEDLPKFEKMIRLPAGRLGTPQDLGAAALFLLSPASEWVTGQNIRISGDI
ncbi:MAG: NAD(P)-dependent dehydrogenase (short-subunit alcohol dehydrogenase family) [Candidatus Azotimanducaceae bacterium]|jgi:3-oxoacyl-[acyl-carrier protein] reductase